MDQDGSAVVDVQHLVDLASGAFGRELPNGGIGYGLLRFLSEDADTSATLHRSPTPEVSFLYLGQLGQGQEEPSAFKVLREPAGLTCDPGLVRTHLLDVVGLVADRRLKIDFSYSAHVHTKKTIERVTQDFMEALRSLITHCWTDDTHRFTPSDFPGAQLSQDALDTLLAKIGNEEQLRSS